MEHLYTEIGKQKELKHFIPNFGNSIYFLRFKITLPKNKGIDFSMVLIW